MATIDHLDGESYAVAPQYNRIGNLDNTSKALTIFLESLLITC